jgi:hypothetical protein
LQDGKEPLSAAVEIRVTKAVSGSDGKAPTPVPADADKKSAGPSQQPAIASPPKRNVPSSAEAVSWHMAFLPYHQPATAAMLSPLLHMVRHYLPVCAQAGCCLDSHSSASCTLCPRLCTSSCMLDRGFVGGSMVIAVPLGDMFHLAPMFYSNVSCLLPLCRVQNPRFAAPNAAWQQTATPAGFNPLSNLRVLSPLCPSGTEATACASFSGNTAVVVS